MIFQCLMESVGRGELLLIEGGFCRYHLRRDNRLVIHEIIAVPPRQGAGRKMLSFLKSKYTGKGVVLVAKCPASYESNSWYQHMGFLRTATETTPKGTVVNVWELPLS